MPLPANEGRGEVAVTIDGVDLVVAAETRALAELSSLIGCRTQHEILQRIIGAEPFTMFAALDTLVEKGDAAKAKEVLTLAGMRDLADALSKAVMHHAGELKPGNGRGARGKSTKSSPGASG